jgi:hypothetical protein
MAFIFCDIHVFGKGRKGCPHVCCDSQISTNMYPIFLPLERKVGIVNLLNDAGGYSSILQGILNPLALYLTKYACLSCEFL